MTNSLNAQLIEATKAGDDPLARHLIYLGADIHTADQESHISHDAPLAWALRNNNLSLAHTFMQFGASPQAILQEALLYACKDGDLKAFVTLVGHGAEITDAIATEASQFNHQTISAWISKYQSKKAEK